MTDLPRVDRQGEVLAMLEAALTGTPLQIVEQHTDPMDLYRAALEYLRHMADAVEPMTDPD